MRSETCLKRFAESLSTMLFVSALVLTVANIVNGNSIYYCSDMNPQPHVDIEQLMGMWYGIEIISHKLNTKHEIVQEEGCPVLYFSEDRTPSSISPLHKDYNYHQNYGAGYGRGYQGRHYDTTDDDTYVYSTQSTNYDLNMNYDRDYQRYGTNEYNRRRYEEDIKRLRLLWDEKGSYVEYTMRYNVSRAGFWISSGPQNGSSLEAKFNDFAGTIQVLKAVGNHMVLVFCHQLPDRQLYSVLLSRVQNLSKQEIHGVHNLLNRRGLSTSSIRKVCTHNSGANLQMNFLVLVAVFVGLVRSR